ncbi:MAG: glycosyltransferase family 2 protein [Clostridium sp.]|nr:glycosyltransferase family 2 protein [Clostridium sp.]
MAIVILNWNGASMLRRFLPGVVEYSSRQATVYVADNASSDDSLAVLKNFPSVRLITLPKNYGFAEGYNKALAQVEAEYFLLLNSDVEVSAGWLTPLLHYMDVHPETAVCQPKIRSQREPEFFEYAGAAGGYIDCWGYPYCRGRIFSTVESDNGQYDHPVSVFWATGAAFMVRSRVYDEVGGLDGRFFAHMEEIDFCWRLRSRGYGIVCVPSSVVYHVGGGTLSKENPRKTFLNFRNNLLMLYKNLPEERLHRVMSIRFSLDIVAALMFLLTGKWKNCRAVWRAWRAYIKMKPAFTDDRHDCLAATVLHTIPEQSPFCILYRYYIKRERLYSELPDV